MEWWYKTRKYPITSQSMTFLQNALQEELIKHQNLRMASLYDNDKSFYIKTSNNISLHTFLFNHGFEEIYDSVDDSEFNMLFGTGN